jgi:hypothetical protein
MCTRLYRLTTSLDLIYEIPNPAPLAHEVRFSPDEGLLAVLAGYGLGGTSMMIIDVPTGEVISRHGQPWPPKNPSMRHWLDSELQSVSFSSDGELIAIGEGDRVVIYNRPSRGEPMPEVAALTAR